MRLLLFVILLISTACGYRFGHGEVTRRYRTVTIPYVEGDQEGILTAALVRHMVSSGGLSVRNSGADLCLRVCLQVPKDQNIGYTYAPESTGGNSDVVVANEARLTLIARVTLVDRCTGCPVLGPVNIPTSLTYDFESDLSNINFHDFAEGQLQMNNLAKETAFPPLYNQLAQKIVDYVNHGW